LKLESWSVGCVDGFLAVSGMVETFQTTRVGGVGAERPLSQHRPWTDGKPVREVGWRLGPDQRFQQFAVATYVYAFLGG
jgi:hypothetical protein